MGVVARCFGCRFCVCNAVWQGVSRLQQDHVEEAVAVFCHRIGLWHECRQGTGIGQRGHDVHHSKRVWYSCTWMVVRQKTSWCRLADQLSAFIRNRNMRRFGNRCCQSDNKSTCREHVCGVGRGLYSQCNRSVCVSDNRRCVVNDYETVWHVGCNSHPRHLVGGGCRCRLRPDASRIGGLAGRKCIGSGYNYQAHTSLVDCSTCPCHTVFLPQVAHSYCRRTIEAVV